MRIVTSANQSEKNSKGYKIEKSTNNYSRKGERGSGRNSGTENELSKVTHKTAEQKSDLTGIEPVRSDRVEVSLVGQQQEEGFVFALVGGHAYYLLACGGECERYDEGEKGSDNGEGGVGGRRR